MGVYFNCECGKRIRVKENQIDDKVKCPECRKLLVVREKVGDLNARAAKRLEKEARTGWPLWLIIVVSIGVLLFIVKGIEFVQSQLPEDDGDDDACIQVVRPFG